MRQLVARAARERPRRVPLERARRRGQRRPPTASTVHACASICSRRRSLLPNPIRVDTKRADVEGRLRAAARLLARRRPPRRPRHRPLHGRRAGAARCSTSTASRRVVGASLKPTGELRWYGKVGGQVASGPPLRALGRRRRSRRQPLAPVDAGSVRIRYVELASPVAARDGRRRRSRARARRTRARVAWRLGKRTGVGAGAGVPDPGPDSARPLPARRRPRTATRRRRRRRRDRRRDATALDRRRARSPHCCSRSAAVVAGLVVPRADDARRRCAGRRPSSSSRARSRRRSRGRRRSSRRCPGRRTATTTSGRTSRRSTHRPPYRQLWMLRTRWYVEFPPVVGYGKVFVSQLKGVFYAVDAKTGKWHWKRKFPFCSASSPTLARRPRDRDVHPAALHDGAAGRARARDRDARSGRPHRVAAADRVASRRRSSSAAASTSARGTTASTRSTLGTGKVRWSTRPTTRSTARPRTRGGMVFVGDNSGTLTALDARTGAMRWNAQSFSHFRTGREYFYATPTVAYGRVFASQHRRHDLRVRRRAPATCSGRATSARTSTRPRRSGTGTVYVGTYDGKFYALDAATGDTRWVREMPAAGPRRADGDGRPRLPRDLRLLRPARHPLREARAATAPTRSTPAPASSSGRSRTASTRPSSPTSERVYLVGATPGLRAGASARALSALREQHATAIPVSGQTRYEVWKTRAMKSRTKIETAKPAAASQSRPERRTSPDEPRRHRQPDDAARGARTGTSRSGRRSSPAFRSSAERP